MRRVENLETNDINTSIKNSIDDTKRLNFDISGGTSGITTLFTSQTSNINVVLPASSTTLIGDDTNNILINKTIDSTSNEVTCNSLRNATGKVSVDGATAPTPDQVLMSASVTNATWQTLPWVKTGGGTATQSDTTIEYNSGNIILGDYGTGNHLDTNPIFFIAVTSDGRIVEYDYTAPPPPTNPLFYKATGAVNVSGGVLTTETAAGATITRAGVGQYNILFSSPANNALYPVLATMSALPQNDDYQWAYLNRTVNGFSIEIREQDNGTAAGTLVDSGFSFFVPNI